MYVTDFVFKKKKNLFHAELHLSSVILSLLLASMIVQLENIMCANTSLYWSES